MAAWEQLRQRLFTQQAFRDTFPRLQEMVHSGRAEYFTIEATS